MQKTRAYMTILPMFHQCKPLFVGSFHATVSLVVLLPCNILLFVFLCAFVASCNGLWVVLYFVQQFVQCKFPKLFFLVVQVLSVCSSSCGIMYCPAVHDTNAPLTCCIMTPSLRMPSCCIMTPSLHIPSCCIMMPSFQSLCHLFFVCAKLKDFCVEVTLMWNIYAMSLQRQKWHNVISPLRCSSSKWYPNCFGCLYSIQSGQGFRIFCNIAVSSLHANVQAFTAFVIFLLLFLLTSIYTLWYDENLFSNKQYRWQVLISGRHLLVNLSLD